MKPTLTTEEISRLEEQHGISLSADYRWLLQHLGNGGAGPGYGLESFSPEHVQPPYPGTDYLLRNWDDPSHLDIEMVDSDEISGYVQLFNYGCGMQTCLIVNGPETGDMIFFDCDDCFRKVTNRSLAEIYEDWLDDSIAILSRVDAKLQSMPLQEVIDSEWALENSFVNEMILSLIGAKPLSGGFSGNDMKAYLQQEYQAWQARK